MARYNRVGTHKTKVINNDGVIAVFYHNTRVVYADKERITLFTGGWFSKTTKLRMNQAANQFDLGYSVYQKDHQWYVVYGNVTRLFEGSRIDLERN